MIWVEAEHGAREALRRFLNFGGEGAGIDEREAPSFPRGFCSIWRLKCQERIMEMRRVAGSASEAVLGQHKMRTDSFSWLSIVEAYP